VVLAFVEPRAGGARVTLTCGGHPLPFHVSGGQVTAVGQPGMVIGLFPDPQLDDTELWLGPGDGILLYTDGVTEARSITGDFQPDLLPKMLAAAADRTAEGLVDAADQAVLQFE